MAKIFISHRKTDKEQADKLAQALCAAGHGVWFDEWEIDVGDSIVGQINQGMKTCDCLVLCYSASGTDSSWVRQEWETALARQLEGKTPKVLPVCLTGREGPAILDNTKVADLTRNWASGLAALLAAIPHLHIVHDKSEPAPAESIRVALRAHGIQSAALAGEFYPESASVLPVILCLTGLVASRSWVTPLVKTAREKGRKCHVLLMDGKIDSDLLKFRLGDIQPIAYHADPTGSMSALAAQINPAPSGKSATSSAKEPAIEEDLTPYCAWALKTYGHLAMIGVGGAELTMDLANVYIPLRISQRGALANLEQRKSRPTDVVAQQSDGDVELTEIFSVGKKRHVALFGDPGAGKSTALRKLLHHILVEGAGVLGLPEGTIPLFLRLRRFEEAFLKQSLDVFIQSELGVSSGYNLPPDLGKRLWDQGNLLLLFDGLDEIASQDLRAKVARYLDAALSNIQKKNIYAVVSCRYAGYGGTVYLGNAFLHLDVRPLDAGQVEDFVRRWFQEAHRTMPKGSAVQAEQESAKLLENLRQKHHANQQIQVLVGNPLLLTLLCVVVLQKYEIPRRRVEFYRQCLEVLLYRWRHLQEGEEPPLTLETALSILRRVAWEMHSSGRQYDMTAQAFAQWAGEVLDQQGHAQSLPDGGLRWFHLTCGVLEEYAPQHYFFMHLGFQEYLAAQHVAAQRQTLVRELLLHRDEKWWKEVILLTAGLEDGDLFVRLVEALLPDVGREAGAEWLRDVLAEAPVVNLTPFEKGLERGTPAEQVALLRLLQGRNNHRLREIAERLAKTGSEAVQAQANRFLDRPAAVAISASTSDRATPAMEIVIEPRTGLRFLPIPGGIFTMGSEGGHGDERPAHPVQLSPYWLAETPVTNRQYGLYLQAIQAKEPEYWRNRRFSDPEQPVVGVDWREATDFCRWLTERGQGLRYILPSEAQWEFAARGLDGRPYPWGWEEPTKERACFNLDRDSGKPAPVGRFPAGRGPFGHLDLAGNVWEWCRDGWSEDYRQWVRQTAMDPVAPDDERRVVRGGSWLRPAGVLRAACRGRDPAGFRRVFLGFRVAAAPSSTLEY